MIHILFPAGAFGSSIEFCIRQFSNEHYDKSLDNVDIRPTGSMHGFDKLFHPVYKHDLLSLLKQKPTITTPTYPNNDQDSQEVIDTLVQVKNKSDKVVFVTLDNIEEKLQIQILVSLKTSLDNWAKNYHALQNPHLEHWEKLEECALALNEYSNNLNIPADWIQIGFNDLLTNYKKTIQKIFHELGLTFIHNDKFDRFTKKFENFQNQILQQKYFPVKNYAHHAILGDYFCRGKFDIVQESIAIALLLNSGYQIEYKDNDTDRRLPYNSHELYELLSKL